MRIPHRHYALVLALGLGFAHLAQAGEVLTINGPAPASVFINVPNDSGSGRNGSTTGGCGGRGATTAPLSAGPDQAAK